MSKLKTYDLYWNSAKSVAQEIIETEESVVAIAVGGSFARNNISEGSDLDLLKFDSGIQNYSKQFRIHQSCPIEIHNIPLNLANALFLQAQPLLCECNEIITNYDPSIFGQKRCPEDKVQAGNLNKGFAAWRELRKLLRTKLIIEKNNWYTNFQKKFKDVKVSTNKLDELLVHFTNEPDAVESAISILKLDACYQGYALSKVYYIDEYLQERNSSILTPTFLSILPRLESIPQEWLNFARDQINLLENSTSKIVDNCSVCDGEVRQCHLGRCSLDYWKDTQRAIIENRPIGAILSLASTLKYCRSRFEAIGMNVSSIPKSYDDFWNEHRYNRITELEKLVNVVHNVWVDTKMTKKFKLGSCI